MAIKRLWDALKIHKGRRTRLLSGLFLMKSGASPLICMKRRGIRYRFYPSALSMALWIKPFARESVVESFIRRYLRPGDVVVDAGANIGTLTLLASTCVGKTGKVHAFEPHPQVFSYLKGNVILNGCDNVHLHDCALGNENGEITFSDQKADDFNCVLLHGSGIPVPIRKLDDLNIDDNPVALLNVDVEGYEKFVFEGGLDLLRRVKCIVIEVWDEHFRRFGYQFPDLYRLLDQQGFGVFELTGEILSAVPRDRKVTRCTNFYATRTPEELIQRTGHYLQPERRENERPFFSIVTPIWNRSDSLRRCFDSVFAQTFQDYELIAVDDGSTDNSVEIMSGYRDPRLRIIRLPENRGVCGARHVGTGLSRGRWVLSLDTDWALLPHTLEKLADMARQAAPDVGIIGGCARADTGEIWPSKPFPPGPFGFVEYLRWCDREGASDYVPCRRREVFDQIQWPTDRRLERQFHLSVARNWKMWVTDEVIARAYTDSPNRITGDRSAGGLARQLQMAAPMAEDCAEILARFGKDLKQYAPREYWTMFVSASLYSFQAGWRLTGLKYAFSAWIRRPWAIQVPAMAMVGLFGPDALLAARKSGRLRQAFNYFHRLVMGASASRAQSTGPDPTAGSSPKNNTGARENG